MNMIPPQVTFKWLPHMNQYLNTRSQIIVRLKNASLVNLEIANRPNQSKML